MGQKKAQWEVSLLLQYVFINVEGGKQDLLQKQVYDIYTFCSAR